MNDLLTRPMLGIQFRMLFYPVAAALWVDTVMLGAWGVASQVIFSVFQGRPLTPLLLYVLPAVLLNALALRLDPRSRQIQLYARIIVYWTIYLILVSPDSYFRSL